MIKIICKIPPMSTGDQILKLDDENHKIKKNNWGINWDNKQMWDSRSSWWTISDFKFLISHTR